MIFLSQVTTPVIGWISWVLGWIMNGVYNLLDIIGAPSVGWSIVLYTIIVYMCMYPLTVKQQKLSRMMMYVQPEINAVQKKYKGRRDQASQLAMNEEIQGVYAKYGTSPYGSCLPLIIQLPLLFALYGVIQNIPGYISKVAAIFSPLATKIISIEGGAKAFAQFVSDNNVQVVISGFLTKTKTIDALYRLTPSQFETLQNIPAFSTISADISQVAAHSEKINTFLGINISESPISAIQQGWADGAFLVVLGAILIPVLAWFTQWINLKLTPQSGNNADAPGGNSMNIMGNFMPIFSAVICLTFSMGIGVYWIAGAVIRSVQMIIVNRRLMKVDMEELIAKNIEKNKEKMKRKAIRKKEYVEKARMNQQAHYNTKKKYTNNQEETVDYSKNAADAHPESLTARANMVLKYDAEHPAKSSGKKSKSNKKK